MRDVNEFVLDASFMGDKRTFPNRGKILAQWKAIVDRHNSHSNSNAHFRYVTEKSNNWKKVVQVRLCPTSMVSPCMYDMV